METNWKRSIDPILLERAREMRHQSAPAEAVLWWCLRDRRLDGIKFRRQHVNPPFIADFYCHELKLVIELDGDSHGTQKEYDDRRTERFMREGMHVIRFLNTDVFDHLDSVLDAIWTECDSLRPAAPHPNPLPKGEGTRNSLPLPSGEGRGEGQGGSNREGPRTY